MSAFDVDEWLGAEVTIKGKVETLPDRVQEALKKGFEDDLWTEADVPDEGTTLEEVDMLARLVLFGAAHEDSCKILKQECYKTDKIRFARWFRAGYGEEVILDATFGTSHGDYRVRSRYGCSGHDTQMIYNDILY